MMWTWSSIRYRGGWRPFTSTSVAWIGIITTIVVPFTGTSIHATDLANAGVRANGLTSSGLTADGLTSAGLQVDDLESV